MSAILKYLWDHRTTTLGYIQIILGVAMISQDLFSAGAMKWIVFANGCVTAVLGHYNNSQIKALKAQVGGTQEKQEEQK